MGVKNKKSAADFVPENPYEGAPVAVSAFDAGSQSKFNVLKYFGVVGILLLVAGIAFIAFQKNTDDTVGVCDAQLIQDASRAINDNDLAKLKSQTAGIKKDKEHSKDQNCLFILTRYATLQNDPKSARDSLEKLKKVYKPSVGYSTEFTTDTKLPEEFEETVAFLEQRELNVRQQSSDLSSDFDRFNQAADDAVNGNNQ